MRLDNPRTIHSQELAFGDFTDGGSTTGYIDIAYPIPANASLIVWTATIIEGFTGDTTAMMQVGIDGTADKYSAATTLSCFTTDKVVCCSPGEVISNDISAEHTVRVTVTGGSDFGDITAGKMVVSLHCLLHEVYEAE
jgi:hypothetical protein